MNQSLSAFIVAGTHSGVGKTTVALGLLAALRRHGYKVQPFKIGPDFIDPGLHRKVLGTASCNLDGWMLSRDFNLQIFHENCQRKEVAVVEGMMGLFDGVDGNSDHASTAEMAKWLGLPVILVVDASALARSAAAMVLGYLRFDPKLKVLGVIFNRIAGQGHFRYLKEAMSSLPELEFFGALPQDDRIIIPERHLGLMTAAEGMLNRRTIRRLADWIEAHLDLGRLLRTSRAALPIKRQDNSRKIAKPKVTIGVAEDEAFCFYYPDNLRLLRAAGARLVPFSPIRDHALPYGAGALYFGGGYPELYARQLARNRSMRKTVRRFIDSGGFVYAECGGFMYLTKGLIDHEGRLFPMVGIYPVKSKMSPRLMALGYREIQTKPGSFFPSRLRARGHEFHHSEIIGNLGDEKNIKKAYKVTSQAGSFEEGFAYKNCLGSYIHLHLGSNPSLAKALVNAASEITRL